MNAYSLRAKALEDLDNIWVYTAENWSVAQADRYYKLVIDELEYLARNPESGKSMEHIKMGYRASKVKSHLIFYKTPGSGPIEIIRILHERMDIENRLND